MKDPVTNKATVSVGDHDYDTNTTGGDVEVNTGDLTISKEIILTEGQGTEIDTDKEFTFTITLTGTKRSAVNRYLFSIRSVMAIHRNLILMMKARQH